MSDGGKGSAPRPIPDKKTYEQNWNRIFSRCSDCGKKLVQDSVHTCSPQQGEQNR